MKKKWMLFLLALLTAVSANALATSDSTIAKRAKNTRDYNETSTKRADVFRLVPHLAVSGQWKSALTFRSDNEAGSLILLEFYDEFGQPVVATFYDSDGFEYTATGFEFELFGWEIYQLEFDQLANGFRSLQVFAFVDETQDTFGLEAVYNNFSGQDKLSSVGVTPTTPGDLFIVNLDQGIDAYTQNRKFRGMAVTNVSLDPCRCEINLFNTDGSSTDRFGAPFETLLVDIPGSGKWLGTIYDLYPNINDRLNNGLGYIQASCSQLVSVLALGFEEGAPIVSSVPVDYFVVTKAKDGLSNRQRQTTSSLSVAEHRD